MIALTEDEEIEVAHYEDLRACANRAVWTVELQVRRLRDFIGGGFARTEFVLQPVSDTEFLVLALDRLLAVSRQIAAMAGVTLAAAISEYEQAIPNLHKARNVIAHIDEYLRGDGHDRTVRAGALSTHAFGDDRIDFAGFELDLGAVLAASEKLFSAIRSNTPSSYQKAVSAQGGPNAA